jgi:hypothetical protein
MRYNTALHLTPGCCHFQAVVVEQFDFADRK